MDKLCFSIILISISAFCQANIEEDFKNTLEQPTLIGRQPNSMFFNNPNRGARLTHAQPIFNRILNGFQIKRPSNNHNVNRQLRYYTQNVHHLNQILDRARPYVRHILKVLEAKNLPTEFILLPILESAYDPFAYSYVRAAGLWQIIPQTGQHLNLKQNWWYDGRRDIYTSTEAATDYLQYLHDRFKDWLLVLAAYNWGETRVALAIRKNRKRGMPTDFWSLKLPHETNTYIPRLLALAELMANAKEHGLNLPHLENSPNLVKVDIGDQIDLSYVAHAANLTLKEVYTFNPGFNRWATPPEGPYHLLLPEANVSEFHAKLKSLPSTQATIKWLRYRVTKGDSLIKIAEKYRTTTEHLKAINSIERHHIREGQHLFVPVASNESTVLLEETPVKSTVIVEKGHTLWDIGQDHGVTIQQLTEWNDLTPNDFLQIGQKLTVYSVPDFDERTPFLALDKTNLIRKIKYRVRKGDSIALIANKFKVSPAQIRTWNNLSQDEVIHPGDRLALSVDITEAHENL